MIKNETAALDVARYILEQNQLKTSFEKYCRDLNLSPETSERAQRAHVYGMAVLAVRDRDAECLNKCCRYVLRSEQLRKDFQDAVTRQLGQGPHAPDRAGGLDHVFGRALNAMGSDVCDHFPRLFTKSSRAA